MTRHKLMQQDSILLLEPETIQHSSDFDTISSANTRYFRQHGPESTIVWIREAEAEKH